MKTYTIGEIVRLGLLKNHSGLPYKHKATVLKIVQGLKYKKVKTVFGEGYAVTQREIDRFNKHWG